MTRKQLIWWAVALVAMAALMFGPALFVHAPANGATRGHIHEPGSTPHIKVRAEYKVWTRDVKVTLPHTDLPSDVHVQATVTVEYYYWKGWPKSHDWKGRWITPFGVDLCYAFKGGYTPGILWQGISADTEWFDDTQAIEVTNLRTGDHGRGGCEHEKVPLQNRVWLHSTMKKKHIPTNPFWLADGWINWAHFPDQSFHWHTPRIDDSKALWPSADHVMTTPSGKEWRTILKNW